MPESDLSVFFRPNGVAVIGASNDEEKLGHGVVRNLRSVRYEGPIYPVNSHEDEILGYKAYPSIADVPDPVDLAVIVVPAQAVAMQMEACGKRGIKGAIVVSGGFREMGASDGGVGAEREREIKRIADKYGIRVIGPNCIGTIDAHTPLNTTFVTGMPRPGDIAFVSQSGAMAAAVMDWAVGSGVGFSRIVSLGNQVDVSTAEMLGQIGLDNHTRVIMGYMEGVDSGRAFIEAAEQAARKLPVVFLKAGRGASGTKAAASHTGALAGDLTAYQAAFRRAGVLWANTMEELVDCSRALAWQPLPKGSRVAILTNAGGPAILATDALEQAGMQLAPLTGDTKAFLRQRVFAAASVENPVDILAGAGPATYALCLDALLADETVDAVVVIQAPQDWFKPVSLAEVAGEVANRPSAHRKPILTVIMGLASTSEATQILHRRHVPNYAFPERVGSTLGAMWARKQWLDELETQAPPAPLEDVNSEIAQRAIEATLANTSGWASPESVEALMAAYHIPVPGSGLAMDAEGAVVLAEKIGYPVVLKLAASGVTHKTDVGGVVLNIQTPEQLRSAYEAMMQSARSNVNGLAIQGAHVQRMVKGLAELIVGVTRDPQFGPLVMAGIGGTEVELRRNVAFELAPLTAKQANDLLDRTPAGRLLDGFRGATPADRSAAANVILRLAQIALDRPEIQEIEVNPLIVMAQGEGALAVDARLRVSARSPL